MNNYEKKIHLDNPGNIHDFTIGINTTPKIPLTYLTIKGEMDWMTTKENIEDKIP